jgi:hypothetical protein
MKYMLSLDLLKAGVLGSRPLTGTQFTCITSAKVQILTSEALRAVVTRDPAKGAGGRLYPKGSNRALIEP